VRLQAISPELETGTVWLRSTEGADPPESASAEQFKIILPCFNPGKEFKQVLERIDFEKGT